MSHTPISAELEKIARHVVDAGLQVHRSLGPGLLESAYEHCLVHELTKRLLPIQRQTVLPVSYQGENIEAGYRVDVIVSGQVIIEIKSVEALMPLHEAQVLTYLKLSGLRLGFLLNFNVPMFKHGIRRFVL